MERRAAQSRYHDLLFDADFLTARRDTGERIRFSRFERSALSMLTSGPGRLFSREQLLSAMSSEPGDLNDRNVDVIVSRLRKKLRDSARRPRFIATQYGEGYIWIAKPEPDQDGGFLVVGPVRGLRHGARRAAIQDAIEKLTGHIAERCAVGQRIACLPNWSGARTQGAAFRFSVSVDLIENEGRVQGAFALRDGLSERVIRVVRSDFANEHPGDPLRHVATALVGAVWRDLTLAPAIGADPAGPPLELRMQNAAMTLSRSVDGGWSYIGERLSEELADAPDDPQLAMMQATYLYARMLLEIDFDSDPASFRQTELEIERLVCGALPAIRADVIFRLAAAKLLFLVGEKHLPLVEALIRESLAEGTSFAAALAVLGTVQSYRGELDEAIASFDQALAFCEEGSEFQIFLLVKKSVAMLAGRRWGQAREILHQILTLKPAARGRMELFWVSPHEPIADQDAQAALARLSRMRATRLLIHHYEMFGRYFSRPEQAENVMAGPTSHIVAKFGPSVVPESLAQLCLPKAPLAGTSGSEALPS